MKKVYSLSLLIIGLFVSLSANADMFTAIALTKPHYYPGEVYFADGHSEVFAELQQPYVGKAKLAAKKNESDKSRTEIDVADIVAIKIWHKDFPDQENILYHLTVKKELLQSAIQWGFPVAGSKWGVLYKCIQYYEMDNKTGELKSIRVYDEYNNATEWYYLMRPNWGEGRMMICDNISGTLKGDRIKSQFAPNRKKAAEPFKENKKIYDGIVSGELKPSDIQYILDEMAGGKATAPATETPAVETQKTTNGEVGDDE